MNEQCVVLAHGSGQSAEEIHPHSRRRQLHDAAVFGWRVFCFAVGFELASRPEDGLFGGCVEAFGVEQRAAVVIAEHTELELHHDIQALAGLGTITDDIAQANDSVDVLGFNVLKDRLQCSQIAVNIAKDRSSSHLSAVLDSVTELIRQVGLGIDLVGGCLNIVFNSAKGD